MNSQQTQVGVKRSLRVSFVVIGICVAGLSGCGSLSRQAAIVSLPGEAMQGRVYGGQQPVVGASILLYAAGSAGPGTGAINLLAGHTVLTDSLGNFTITGDYTCPSANTQVYLIARGGNPGLPAGSINPAIVLVAAIGDCGSLSAASFISVNEVTTAAAAWALSQFAGPGGIVGASATNATGLRNAFTVAANLADSATGLTPGSAMPAAAVTETAKLNTLADALASCVNSDGGASCTPLFSAATVSGTVPSNIFDAAVNIVRNPGHNVTAVFRAAGPAGPFQPTLDMAPNDWTMSITYSGGGLNQPGSLAIDSAGNVVAANYFGAVVSKFSPSGVPISTTGFPGVGLTKSYGITVDPYDQIWVTNEQSVTAANNQHLGSVSEFTSNGIELSGAGFVGGGTYYPKAAAATSAGNIWIADFGSSSATLLSNDGNGISGPSGFGNSQLPFPSAVAVDAAGNAWFAVEGGAVHVTTAGDVSRFLVTPDPTGIAVDAAGKVWVAEYYNSTVYELNASGAVLTSTQLMGGNGGPQGIAVDGAGNVWTANYYGNTLMELDGTSAGLLSPVGGFGLDAPLDEPYSVAIDASGNLWMSNSASPSMNNSATGVNSITQVVGIASPVRTPLLGPPVQP